jgi:vacuolar-type H+-ATPase subunit I/STV1
MIGRLLSLAVVFIIGLVVFNTLFGTEEDKENVQKVTSGVKDLFKSTKAKYQSGQYDEAIDKIGDVFKKLKNRSDELDNPDYANEITELEQKKRELEQMLKDLEDKQAASSRSLAPQDHAQEKAAILEQILDIERQANSLAQKMDKE